MEEKNRGGRPATGKQFPHRVTAYFDGPLLKLLKTLAEKMNGRGRRGEAATIREALVILDRYERGELVEGGGTHV